MHTFLITLLTGLFLFISPAPVTAPAVSEAVVAESAAAATYQIDPYHTNIGFRIRHMGIAFVEGEFGSYDGTITLDPANLAATRAEVTIQAASIDTDVQQRDDHLRSADFFEVETYPTMTFVSKSAQPTGPNTFRLIGDLTIKGTTREVALDATLGGPIPIENGQRVGFHATTQIDRRDFGITWGADLPGGFPAVGHQVQIVLDVEAVSESAS